MPNWCFNSLTITGPAIVLDELERLVVGKPTEKEDGSIEEAELFSFNSIIPCPSYIYRDSIGHADQVRLKGMDWYNWNNANWGTKWDASDVEVIRSSPDTLIYNFQTAWSPPTPVTERLSAEFPEVEINHYYDEPGMNFAGTAVFKEGELISERTSTSEEYWAEELVVSNPGMLAVWSVSDLEDVQEVLDKSDVHYEDDGNNLIGVFSEDDAALFILIFTAEPVYTTYGDKPLPEVSTDRRSCAEEALAVWKAISGAMV